LLIQYVVARALGLVPRGMEEIVETLDDLRERFSQAVAEEIAEAEGLALSAGAAYNPNWSVRRQQVVQERFARQRLVQQRAILDGGWGKHTALGG